MAAAADLARDMRAAADTIRKVNKLYDFNPDYGVWSPDRLRHEADVVATVDDSELESEEPE